ncbi:unnamed protein product [Haemonchus placei]|uniref:PhetRS_B1 domain-containing protein n=1 Tax=Haemonchus placei TaxID=6290 RepID=A0A0N4W479_HAEPC|nr:unnamed protein product [Haemonchus placei]
MRRCVSTPAPTIFFVYAPTSSYDEEELEAFCMDLELYREDHTFFKDIVGDLAPEERLKSSTSGFTECIGMRKAI